MRCVRIARTSALSTTPGGACLQSRSAATNAVAVRLSWTTNGSNGINRTSALRRWSPNAAICSHNQCRMTVDRNFATTSSEEPKRTPLYDLHASLGAKFVPFGGYSMPLQYEDLSHLESHKWTRNKASLFDVSHMVQHLIKGKDFLMRVTPSALDKLPENQSTLSCFLDENGGIVDDTVITLLDGDDFYFVTNAGCRENDIAFLKRQLNLHVNNEKSGKGLDWKILEGHALLALQGPLAASVLEPLITDGCDGGLSTLYFGQCRHLRLHLPDGTKTGTMSPQLLVSRTGYTGEDGFEISIPPLEGGNDSQSSATMLAKALLANENVRMAGLAARDSLRLEAGMCLYGHDLNIDTKPAAAGLGWLVAKDRRSGDRANFNGAEEVIKQIENPKSMGQRRVGFMVEKGPPAREGAEIVHLDTRETLGRITSGLRSPTLNGQNIAMGYIQNGFHKSGTKIGIKVRNKVRRAEVVKMPFVPAKFYRNTAPA